MNSLSIDLLGTIFSLEPSDERLLPLLQRLWKPFVVDSPPLAGLKVRLETPDGGGLFQIGNSDPEPARGPWGVLIGSRNAMVALALDQLTHLVPIHAAALACNGRGILLAGESLAGKTRLTVELLGRGCHLLSDDTALLDPVSNRIVAFPKPLGMRLQPWDKFRHLWEPIPEWLPRPPGSYLVPAQAFFCDESVDQVSSICFIAYEPDGPDATLDEISTARSIALCVANMRRIDLEALDSVGRLCARAKCARLSYADFGASVRALVGFIEEVVASLQPGQVGMVP